MEKAGITLFQAMMIIMTASGLMNHVIVIPILLEVSGRDSWISVCLTCVACLLWIPVLYFIMKKTNQQHILEWLKQKYGRFFSGFLLLVSILYLFLISGITLKETIMWTKVSYLPATPTFVLALTFALLCFYNSYCGIKSIAVTTGILLPVIVVLGFFVATANISNKDYSLLKPWLEYGFHPVISGMAYVGSGLVELILLIFIQHHIRATVTFTSLTVITLILTGLTLGPTMAGIAEFGAHQAASQRYPAFEEWRLVSIGRYIEHLDFLSIYQWLSGAFIRISLASFMIIDTLKISDKKKKIWSLVLIYIAVFGFTISPISDMKFYMFLRDLFLPVSLVIMLMISFILAGFAAFTGEKKGG
ncbi:spore germination protein (amino acid permease) [Aneurinibacillus soli]|uniref:Spore germination protein n=1 Tax=Aneurinibacillus soli TaxID=1500254 RepID=A0A0U5AUU8_9BACL|nr:endospore germination permease [Aneurinibacillus soli]PYE58069.1 spore germination protein (amino acid permease) [Aneurinibacillus soli]BAU25970.1 Spore germination protein [Aneurinibacillus soli]